jgi:hypothetical protein
MKFSQKLRQIWHDAFYKNASKERVEFALKCQDVTARIDLHEKPTSLNGLFRFWLHLSLCRACKNYFDLSKVLSKAIKKSPPPSVTNLEKINNSLLERYGQKKK